MALRSRKPTSPGRRFQTVSDFAELTRSRPERSLIAAKPATGGRNVAGRKTSRHRGGGHKQQYRVVDFRRNKDGVPVYVTEAMVGPKLGEFALTRTFRYHAGQERSVRR